MSAAGAATPPTSARPPRFARPPTFVRQRGGRRRPSPATLAATVLTSGCLVAGLSGCLGVVDDDSAQGGLGLPQQLDGETYPGARDELAGTVVVAENGCFLLDVDGVVRLAIWPAGSRGDGDGVVLPDGDRLVGGSGLAARGTVLPVTGLAGGPDGYWATVVQFCVPDDRDVVVLDEAAAG
jgi:hypothetical protein